MLLPGITGPVVTLPSLGEDDPLVDSMVFVIDEDIYDHSVGLGPVVCILQNLYFSRES